MKFSALAAAGAFTLIAGVVPAAADDLEAKQLPEGTGKESVVKVCMACHGSGAFRNHDDRERPAGITLHGDAQWLACLHP